jgi:hypothetical protein
MAAFVPAPDQVLSIRCQRARRMTAWLPLRDVLDSIPTLDRTPSSPELAGHRTAGDGPRDVDRTVPVHHQGTLVGEIVLSKPPGEPFTQAERRLLEDLAAQAGAALNGVRLDLELQGGLAEITVQASELRASRQTHCVRAGCRAAATRARSTRWCPTIPGDARDQTPAWHLSQGTTVTGCVPARRRDDARTLREPAHHDSV